MGRYAALFIRLVFIKILLLYVGEIKFLWGASQIAGLPKFIS